MTLTNNLVSLMTDFLLDGYLRCMLIMKELSWTTEELSVKKHTKIQDGCMWPCKVGHHLETMLLEIYFSCYKLGKV